MALPTDLCGALHHARESLCIAQTHAEWPGHRAQLQEALDTIDRIGAFSCPTWSKYDLPTTDLDGPTYSITVPRSFVESVLYSGAFEGEDLQKLYAEAEALLNG